MAMSKAEYAKDQAETNLRYRAKGERRRGRAIKELDFQDRIRSKETMARFVRCAA